MYLKYYSFSIFLLVVFLPGYVEKHLSGLWSANGNRRYGVLIMSLFNCFNIHVKRSEESPGLSVTKIVDLCAANSGDLIARILQQSVGSFIRSAHENILFGCEGLKFVVQVSLLRGRAPGIISLSEFHLLSEHVDDDKADASQSTNLVTSESLTVWSNMNFLTVDRELNTRAVTIALRSNRDLWQFGGGLLGFILGLLETDKFFHCWLSQIESPIFKELVRSKSGGTE